MNVLIFSAKKYDRKYLSEHNQSGQLSLTFTETRLGPGSCQLAGGYDAICVFVNDVVDDQVLDFLATNQVRHIALRCAGFNNIDLASARRHGISVSRVPHYSPESVAEHTVSLMLTLNRKTHKAFNRVRESNFSLNGLLGFNMFNKTVGIIGTGNIGIAVANILLGMGCKLLCHDPLPNPALQEKGVQYVELGPLCQQADIISLHCPLTAATKHIINADSIEQMKPGVMLINTSRGGLIDTPAVINGLKSHQIGYLGLDVYEMESELFFEDLSDTVIQDDTFERLLSFPNVLLTGHQGFFTHEALQQIAQTTLNNLRLFAADKSDPETFLTL
ncbi:2-hydroxyacid dehydrogenase [Neptunicella sp. SCSIO 80796]|uniref:2-hydroxyacid dehydrogenase n=1 Tax=Neptunicella plasticusilytica TaxID=3117012 RepID=UPI003A4DE54D